MRGEIVAGTVRVARAAAEPALDRTAAAAQDRTDVDEQLIARLPGRGRRAARLDRSVQHLRAAAEGGNRGSEHLRVGDRGDRDRVGCGAGRAGGAEAEVLAVVAGSDHGEDT